MYPKVMTTNKCLLSLTAMGEYIIFTVTVQRDGFSMLCNRSLFSISCFMCETFGFFYPEKCSLIFPFPEQVNHLAYNRPGYNTIESHMRPYGSKTLLQIAREMFRSTPDIYVSGPHKCILLHCLNFLNLFLWH